MKTLYQFISHSYCVFFLVTSKMVHELSLRLSQAILSSMLGFLLSFLLELWAGIGQTEGQLGTNHTMRNATHLKKGTHNKSQYKTQYLACCI